MRSIERAFDALYPVAVLPLLGDVATAGWDQPDFELRQLRHGLVRPHIDPDHAAPLAHWVGEELDRVLVGRFRWRSRQVDAVALDVEFPAVKGAPQAALLVATEIEIGAAMRAMLFDDTDAAIGIAEGE